ncbi:competence protein CoiA [Macrococcus bovicus]|uniref:competence protein CoiA n=1 Tax=Macrococcus bovicus TaxID=69968 RepID=UPI0025A5D13A|nr:competence protein CoiA family protein [Macrococcus bovicus]WJP98425.1 competence protein CoiA family protein [Macrococcus bovicus]
MLIAVTEAGIYTHAHQADLKVRYRCPVCLKPVTLKQGRYKIAHFSHQRVIDCHKSSYKTESPAHLQGKHHLYDMAREHQVSMEYFLSEIEQIPDILVDRMLAVELQLSVIPVDAILRRSAGYRQLNMAVIWITDDEALSRTGGALKLTAFQRSLVTTERMQLFSYHKSEDQFYCYQLRDVTPTLAVTYERYKVTGFESFTRERAVVRQSYRITRALQNSFIRRCLQMKDVREPTLSALYQLGINHRTLPLSIGIVVPLQFYIRTHPITWQSALLLMLKKKTYSVERFAEQLDYYGVHTHFTEHELAADLVAQYLAAYKNLCVH